MSNPPIDLLSRLHTATVEVDDLERKARKLQERASRLDEKQRLAIPHFSGPWNKQAIEVHLERLEERIKKPVRARNRDRLRNVGMMGKLANQDILDDSEAVDEIAGLVEEIVTSVPHLKVPLLDDTCLPQWLAKGADEAKAKLTAVGERLEGFRRLQAIGLNEDHLAEIVLKTVQEPDTLNLMEARAGKAAVLLRLGIIIPASASVTLLWVTISDAHADVTALQSQFPESYEELRSTLQDKSLEIAKTLAADALKDCNGKYVTHLAEWNRLHQTLTLLGATSSGSMPPRSISAIEKQVEEFRQHCSERIGRNGMELLAFLQGNGEFPTDIKLKAVEVALLALRPFISFKSGELNG